MKGLPLALCASFLTGLMMGIGSILRDCSLTCNVGFEFSPIAFIVIALVMIPFTDLQIKLSTRLPFLRWQIYSTLTVAGILLLFRLVAWILITRHEAMAGGADHDHSQAHAALHSGLDLKILYLSFYVFLAVLFALAVTNLGALIRRVLSDDAIESALGYTASMLMAGQLVGAWIIQTIVLAMKELGYTRFDRGRDHIMLGMAAALFLLIPLIRAANASPARSESDPTINNPVTKVPVSGAPPVRAPSSEGLAATTAWIRREPLLSRLARFTLLTSASHAILFYIFYALVTRETDPAGGRTDFYAGFYIWLNAATLILIAFGGKKVVTRIGVIPAILILPVLLLIGSAFATVTPALTIFFILRVVEGSLFMSLHRAATDRFCMQAAPDKLLILRSMMNNFIGRVGEGLISIVILIMTFGFAAGIHTLILVMTAVFALWVASGFLLNMRKKESPPAGAV